MADLNAFMDTGDYDDELEGDTPDEIMTDLPPLNIISENIVAALGPYTAQLLDYANEIPVGALTDDNTALEDIEEPILDALLALPAEVTAAIATIPPTTREECFPIGYSLAGFDANGELLGSWVYWAKRAYDGDEDGELEPGADDEDQPLDTEYDYMPADEFAE